MNNTIYSPARIKILLRCYCEPVPFLITESEVTLETIKEFLELGVIVRESSKEDDDPNPQIGRFSTTPKGRAWVEALLRVQMPREAFVDESNGVLWVEGRGIIQPHQR